MPRPLRFKLHDGKMGAAITVHIGARSSRNEISEIRPDGTIVVSMTATSSDGHANQGLIQYLAEILQITPGAIEIIGGINGPDKLITIIGLDADRVQEQILRVIS